MEIFMAFAFFVIIIARLKSSFKSFQALICILYKNILQRHKHGMESGYLQSIQIGKICTVL